MRIKALYYKLVKKILPPEKYAKFIGVHIGKNNFIPDKECWSSEPYLITVGNHCQITNGVRLFTHGGGHVIRRQYPEFDTFGKIVIKDWVYIGNNALVMPGVTIGEGVLIAAGSVVTKSVPPNVVIAGNPAKIICTTEEFYDKNSYYNTNTKNCSQEQKKQLLETMPNERFIRKQTIKFLTK